MMEMRDCPEWGSCSAPICPLDTWKKRSHASGDPICMVMREHVKPGADERFKLYPFLEQIRPLAQTLIEELQKMKEKAGEGNVPCGLGEVLYRVESSKTSGSSLDRRKASGERLKQARLAQSATA